MASHPMVFSFIRSARHPKLFGSSVHGPGVRGLILSEVCLKYRVQHCSGGPWFGRKLRSPSPKLPGLPINSAALTLFLCVSLQYASLTGDAHSNILAQQSHHLIDFHWVFPLILLHSIQTLQTLPYYLLSMEVDKYSIVETDEAGVEAATYVCSDAGQRIDVIVSLTSFYTGLSNSPGNMWSLKIDR